MAQVKLAFAVVLQPLLFKLPVVKVHAPAAVVLPLVTFKLKLLGTNPRSTPPIKSFTPAVSGPVIMIVRVAELVPMLKIYVAAGQLVIPGIGCEVSQLGSVSVPIVLACAGALATARIARTRATFRILVIFVSPKLVPRLGLCVMTHPEAFQTL